jgi:predicted transcriptional regulator
MVDPLQGVELRVFRSLLEEEDFDTVEKIGVHLTLGRMVATSEIEVALASLATAGYVQERKPGHWQITSQGYAVKRSLLGELNRK